jgi:[ribosomal protein S18]-alanine N-acetyltransferase
MSDLKIQKLQNDDEIHLCAEVMSKSEPWITLKRTYENCCKMLKIDTSETYVAYSDERFIGFIKLIMNGALTGYIQTLAIVPALRNHGYGTKLIEFAEDRIFAERPNVFLCVSSFNPKAQALYRRLGYELIGELTDYIVRGHSELLFRKTIAPFFEFKR